MCFDYGKLCGRIREIFGTEERFAKALGFSTVTLSFKLNGKREWTQREINKACKLLGLARGDIPEYFFKLRIKKT